MTLKFADVAFICLLSLITGVAGAILHDRFIAPTPPGHLIAAFDPGAFLVQRMIEKSTANTIYDSKDAMADSLKVIDTLAAQGYIVINKSAVLAAPREYFVNPDEPAAPNNGQ